VTFTSNAIRLVTEQQVRASISHGEALGAAREAFVALHLGRAAETTVLELRLPRGGGEIHGKGAYVEGSPYLTVKAATGFPSNSALGLPDSSGLSLVFDSATGLLVMILFDNGYLTQLRTGAAGALAADLLARPDAHDVAIIGSGLQARYQLDALVEVRDIHSVRVVSRHRDNAERYAREVRDAHGVEALVADSIESAVTASDIVVTATPAERPLVLGGWLRPGTHVTAVGSDFPGKQELDAEVLAAADLVVADDFWPGKPVGEIAHAVAAGRLDPDGIVSLGAVAVGEHPGRRHDSDLTVADLTGLGVQDAAVARLVAERVTQVNAGIVFQT
jgi:ornithine cyclodeaminase